MAMTARDRYLLSLEGGQRMVFKPPAFAGYPVPSVGATPVPSGERMSEAEAAAAYGGGGGGFLDRFRNEPTQGPLSLAQFGSIGGLASALAPALLGLLGGTALGGLFGGGDDPSGETGQAMGAPLREGIRFPWQTPGGEGFIAPWTEQVQLPSGRYGQLGKGYPEAFGGIGVAYSWSTGTAVFFRLMDGRIAVQKKNGVWKLYRPKKHIVLSTNPRLSQLRKFDRAYSRLNKMVSKFKGKPKRVTIGPPTKYLSPVEKAQLRGGA